MTAAGAVAANVLRVLCVTSLAPASASLSAKISNVGRMVAEEAAGPVQIIKCAIILVIVFACLNVKGRNVVPMVVEEHVAHVLRARYARRQGSASSLSIHAVTVSASLSKGKPARPVPRIVDPVRNVETETASSMEAKTA